MKTKDLEKTKNKSFPLGHALADVHIHTHLSHDSSESMENHCKQALKQGISTLCFTDHDENNAHMGCPPFDFDTLFKDIKRTRAAYGDKLEILVGIEFSEPNLFPDLFKDHARQPLDMIIGSTHFWMGAIYSSQMREAGDIKETYRTYWQQVYDMVTYGGFDTVGHIDFPKRYLGGELYYDKGLVTEIFKEVAHQGMAIEINTSSLRQGIDQPLPGEDLLELYEAAGAKRLTLGSDAHVARDFGFGLKELYDQYSGTFDIGYFRQRKFIPLQNTADEH